MTLRQIDLSDDDLDVLEVIFDAGIFFVRENYLDKTYPQADTPVDARRDFRAAWKTSQLVEDLYKKFAALRPAVKADERLEEAVANLAAKDDPTYDQNCSLEETQP